MPVQMIQESFAAGEISEHLRGQMSSPLYARGLDRCENFEPLPQGPLLMRGPLEFVDESNFAAPIRLIRFRSSGRPDFILALGDLKLQIFSSAGRLVLAGGGGNLVANGDFSAAGTGWTSHNASFSNGYARITMRRIFFDGQFEEDPGYITRNVNIEAEGDYRFTFAHGGNGVMSAYVDGAAVNSGDLVHLTQGMKAVRFEVGGEYLDYIAVDDVSLKAEAGASLDIVTPWTGLQIGAVQYVSETGQDRMIFVHPNVAPQMLTRNADGTWAFAPVVFTAKPAEWADTNWPGVIEIHKSRSWWSGTPNDRNRVWASKVKTLFDFSVSNPLVASDAIASLDLATKGAIQWFRGRKVLLCGTDEGEHGFLAQGGVITPMDIEANEESDFGAAPVMPVVAGNMVMYVTADRKKVRAIGFDLAQDSWVSRDATFTWSHLTEGLIDEIHFAKHPHGSLVIVSGEQIVGCTLDLAEKVVAAWRFTTEGRILSAAVSNGPQGSAIWIAVQRTNGLFIERVWMHEAGTRYSLDSIVTRVVGGAGEVTSLAHLDGHTVRVICEDALLPDAVVAAGAINVGADYAGKTVTVGLKLPAAKAVSLPKNSKSDKVHSVKIGVILNRSALPKVNGIRSPERTPDTAFDEATRMGTGKFEASHRGWSGEGKITIEQDLPFRTEVQAIYEVVQANSTSR